MTTATGDDVIRLRLDLAYDGSDFSGWAAQPSRRTVQAVLEDALDRVLRLPEPARLTVAGRTDAGVHAVGQVAHLDVPAAAWPGDAGRVLRSLAGVLRRRTCGSAAWLRPRPGSTPGSPPLARRYRYRVCDSRLRPTRCAATTRSGIPARLMWAG